MAAPSSPATPMPADGATNVSATAPAISWTAAGATSCQVFFGVTPPGSDSVIGGVKFPAQGFGSPWPPRTWTRNGIGNLSGGTFTFDEEPNTAGVQTMSALRYAYTFYWQVYATNVDGTTPGPVWKFTTEDPPPPSVSSPSPADAGTENSIPQLQWAVTNAFQPDPILARLETLVVTYDIYFGTTNPPPLVASGITTRTYTPVGTPAPLTTYYWQIVVHAPNGTGTGPVWSFTTEDILVLTKDVTTHDVVNIAAQTTVFSYAVPGGTLSTDRALRVTVIGDYLNNTGSAQNLQADIEFGGSSVAGVTGVSVPSSATRRPLHLECVISAGNATNVQRTRGLGRLGSASSVYADPFATNMEVTNPVLDSTVNQTLAVTLFHNSVANANLSARVHSVWVEKL